MIKLPVRSLSKSNMNQVKSILKKPFIKWLLIAIGVVILIFVVFLLSVFFELRGPINTANQQFSNIKKGDLQAAYNQLSENEKARISLTEFASNFSRLRISTDKNSRLFFNDRRIVDNQAHLNGVLVTNGTTFNMTYVLIQENGAWKISDFNLK